VHRDLHAPLAPLPSMATQLAKHHPTLSAEQMSPPHPGSLTVAVQKQQPAQCPGQGGIIHKVPGS
jgi:hypothetical protein